MRHAHGILLAAFTVALLGFVVGARWDFIHRYGTDLPVWDQWDAEGLATLVPWIEGRGLLPELFAPHNEHRIVLTKLINLGLTLANGQWDQRLEAAFNALLVAALVLGLLLWSRRFLPEGFVPLLGLLVAALFGLPFAWQNVVYGFQSQQCLLIGLALIALTLLPWARAFTVRWWVGGVAALLDIFTMGSGFFAAAVVVGLGLLQLWRKSRPRAELVPTLGLGVLITLLGVGLHVRSSHHDHLQAEGLSDFVLALSKSLAWPWHEALWPAALLWLPWVLLVSRWLTSRQPLRFASEHGAILGVGAWVLLQVLATAYARGAGGERPASRYVDTLIVGTLTNALALGWICTQVTRRAPRVWLASLSTLWLALVVLGLRQQLHWVASDIPGLPAYRQECLRSTRAYLHSGILTYLTNASIPYPSAIAYGARLDEPTLRGLLPASVRLPLALKPRPSSATLSRVTPSLRPDIRAWTSFAPDSPAQDLEWLSEPVHAAAHGQLRIEIRGELDADRIRFEVIDAETGHPFASLDGANAITPEWSSLRIPTPARPFQIRLVDASPTGWLAFSEPIEVARLSLLAEEAVARGRALAVTSACAALGLAFVLVLAKFVALRRPSEAIRP